MASQKQRALYLNEKYGDYIIGEMPIWHPNEGEVQIKVMATSLNPVDWKIKKHGIFYNDFPAVLGTDIAGTIEEIGEGVTGWKKGDRVFNQGQWTNPSSSYQQYSVVPASALVRIPDDMTFDQASTLPVALSTAYVGLYQSAPDGLGLTAPTTENTQGIYRGTPIVVMGGSSSVGQYVIQLARISGFSPIIATASTCSFDFVKDLGATHVLDRKLDADQMKANIDYITDIPIKLVFDAISTETTQAAAMSILDPDGQLAVTLEPALKASERRVIRKVFGMMKLPKNHQLLQPFYRDMLPNFINQGLIKINNIEVLPHGLDGIPDGLKRLESGKVSKLKLVAHPQDLSGIN